MRFASTFRTRKSIIETIRSKMSFENGFVNIRLNGTNGMYGIDVNDPFRVEIWDSSSSQAFGLG